MAKVIIDSREKKCEHIKAYFEKHGIEYEIKKLDVGDYQIEGNSQISVDRKQNLSEISKNLMNAKDHSRFWKEVRRSRDQGVKLFVLIEHGGQIKSIEDVARWSDKYSGVNGRRLADEIYRVHIAYGVEFLFCDKRSTGRRIIELLGVKNE
ncbi:MAG: ERCC4 domain-containing protein [Acutalibacteraceae bacterium]|nr:ERCC4 domain-containing protein [Acutalibacteraceae bacterium]